MTESTLDQQRREAAASDLGAKLAAFHEGLTPNEQRVLDGALRSIAAGAADTTEEDVDGYFTPIWLPLIVVKILEQVPPQPTTTQQPTQRPSQRPRRQ